MNMLSIGVVLSIVILLGLLAWGRIQAFKLFSGLVLIYYIFGLIPLEKMLGNFVNPALITLVVLLLVSQVLEKTTWVQWIGRRMFVPSLRSSIARMGLFVGSSSALLNNTAVVATLMSSVGKSDDHPPSKLLIPLSYLAIFGGTLTLIGTSTHLIINGFIIQAGLQPLGMFDFIYVGGALLVVGTLTLLVLAPKILPAIAKESEQKREYFIEAKLESGSALVGKTVEDAGLRQLEELFLVQVVSGEVVTTPASPQYVLQANDRLMFVGDIQAAAKLLLFPGVTLPGDMRKQRTEHFVEVVLSHTSNLIGQTIKEANFRNKFDAAVVAIRRGSEQVNSRMSEVDLRAGDTLVLVVGADFSKRENLDKNFYFYTQVDAGNHLNTTQSLLAGLAFLAVIALATFEVLPLIKGLFLLMAGFFLFGLTSFNELRRRVPYEIVLIIGAALGVADVMMQTGAAQLLAEGVLAVFNHWGVLGSLIGVYLLTVLITELITNNAAAALGFPIALATAQLLDVSVWPFIMAVAYGASASFLTPYGYQTNLMVYTAGGYHFKDYVKMGLPVSIVYGVTVILLVPVFFPF